MSDEQRIQDIVTNGIGLDMDAAMQSILAMCDTLRAERDALAAELAALKHEHNAYLAIMADNTDYLMQLAAERDSVSAELAALKAEHKLMLEPDPAEISTKEFEKLQAAIKVVQDVAERHKV